MTPSAGDKVWRDLESKLRMAICELELCVRATNCLESNRLFTVGDLVVRNEEELLETRNFGITTLHEVRSKLASHHLRLGMHLGDFGAPASGGR